MESTMRFSSVEEELKYWKKKAMEYKKGMEDAKEELDDFQTHSRDLEHELEVQLEQAEHRNREMLALANRLKMDNDSLRDKLEQAQLEFYAQVQELQTELDQYQSIREDLSKYIRELEQANDDLERAKRATLVSLEDFEGRLNQAIERNAFLESELDEKEALKMMVQRLKDEARDLRQELQIRERDTDGDDCELDNDKKVEQNCKAIDSNKRMLENETQTLPGSPISKSSNQSVPLTPSARISALNIVGDLLRKVGALESKLASCRNLVKDVPPSPNSPNKEQRRSRPLPRGPSAASVPGLIRA